MLDDVGCGALGVSDPEALLFGIYPNPAEHVIYIRNSHMYQIDKVEIYNTASKLVKRVTKDFEQIDVSDMASALYMVLIHSEKGVHGYKLLID